MIRILLKKQLSEIFKAYFFNPKTNRARSKAVTVTLFVLFTLLMVGLMAGMFGGLSYLLSPMLSAGFGWFYFAFMGLLAVFFGILGSVFSTYSGLYLAKDNDLLLSMPIPVKAIMVSRLLGVYLMGLLYSSVVIVPAVVVRFIFADITVSAVVGSVMFILLISFLTLALSCIFGYVVAKISVKLKNKSYITVALAVLFFVAYYYVYFNLNSFLSELMQNIAFYGESIRNKAYPVYIVGMAAEGDALSLAAVSLAIAAVLFITLYAISRSFLKIATSTAAVSKVTYKQKHVKEKSVFGAVLSREVKKFTSSPNYMLNCGLGVLFLIAGGVFMLIKGAELRLLLDAVFPRFKGIIFIIVTALICMMTSMSDSAAPSISLEGKTLWQIRVLPVPSKTVLKAKYSLQLYLNIVPALFCVACVIIALCPGVLYSVLMALTVTAFIVFNALYCLFCGLHKVNLNWTNEIVPIKQGVNVLMAIFGGWAYMIAAGGLYIWLGKYVEAWVYLLIIFALTSLMSFLLYLWINKKGVKVFEQL